ncbi:unnamed protein product [Callosobruchus maculatus]|uniref:Uncharacterized protein n=1 Tax=Callosobruchus maculatus TaxID=64391 RepID=A0A653BHS7_CALMS|nr:unnamed protein product [Callosobruchus maculatus]
MVLVARGQGAGTLGLPGGLADMRSGSLGSARPIVDSGSVCGGSERGSTSSSRSCGDMPGAGSYAPDTPDTLEDARKLVRDLRQKTRAQAQQIMAWRRAYKMQKNATS